MGAYLPYAETAFRILETKPISDAVIYRGGEVYNPFYQEGVRIVYDGEIRYILDIDKLSYLLYSNIIDPQYQKDLAFQIKQVSDAFNLGLDRLPELQDKLQGIKDASSNSGKDSSPPTKDGSGDGSGGGSGGGGGTEETPEQKKAREEAEEKAKEKAAAESAKKAEENLDIAKKLKSAPDSDQCKISRLYTPLNDYYFKNKGEGTEGTSLFLNSNILFCEAEGELAQEQNLTKNNSSDMDLFYLENYKYSEYAPNVELYKVIREKTSGDQLAGIKNIVHIAFPTSPKVTDSLTRNNLQDNQLEMDNIGIKSVSWHFDGTDRFTADKYVSAEIVLVTENFDSLFVNRNVIGQSTGVTNVNQVDQSGLTYRIADLLFRPGCLDVPVASRTPTQSTESATSYSSDLTNEYTPECFEILMVAGNSKSTGGSKKMRASMFLTLLDHQFDFKENGSVEVRIRYRGRLEAVLRSPAADVTIGRNKLFASDDLLKQVADIAKVQYLEEKYVELFKKYAPDESGASPQQVRIVNYNELQKQITGLLGKLNPNDTTKKENSALKEAKFKLQQIETLIDKDVKLQFFAQVSKILVDNKKIYNFRINSVETVMQEYINEPSEKTWTALIDYYATQFQDPSAQSIVTVLESVPEQTKKPEQPSEDPPASIAASSPTPAPATPAPADSTSPPADQEIEDSESQEEASVPKDIPFVFFGDLLDSIITVCNNNKPNGEKNNIFQDIKIVLSNIKLPNFSGLGKGKLTVHSIASLPVAYKTVNSFANNKTSIGKKSYSFLSLIRDMINFILPECLGTQCSQNQFMPSVRSNLYSFTSFGEVGGFTSTTVTAQTPLALTNTAGGVNLKTTLPSFKDEYDHSAYLRTARPNITEMLLVYVENTDYSSNNTGHSIEVDKGKGIPWYIFGYDRGIFKKAQLTKMDQPFVLEARFRENKGAYLNQFSNMYKATIEMVGNNLLNVGGYIWLDFSGISNNLGSPKNGNSISYYMGLGGLYLIIDIKSNMVPGNFTTTVEARFVSRGTSTYIAPADSPGGAGTGDVVVIPPAITSPSNTPTKVEAVAAPAPSTPATSVTTIEEELTPGDDDIRQVAEAQPIPRGEDTTIQRLAEVDKKMQELRNSGKFTEEQLRAIEEGLRKEARQQGQDDIFADSPKPPAKPTKPPDDEDEIDFMQGEDRIN